MHNGTQLLINATTGDLASISDRNNNSLTFTGMDIESSSGPAVTFQRDYAGRIISITSSGGQTLSYQYDDGGNLVGFTDAAGNTTQFTYLSSPAHYLNTIFGPNGVQAAATQYDTSGRISSITDAAGNSQTFTYDLSAKSQTTVDALGNPTTTFYDADGNPIEVINALGGITRSNYDSNDNLLSQTIVTSQGNLTTTYTYDAAGDLTSTTSPDGTMTSATYNDFGEKLTDSDSFGNTTRYNYDSNGNLLTSTDAEGNTARVTYDSKGNVSSTTDALGNITRMSWSTGGTILSVTDPFGQKTSLAYDSNGNQTGSSRNWLNPNNSSDIRAVSTSSTYDANGNVTSTTDVWGRISTTTYTSTGRIATTTTANGDVEENTYDARGELIQTREQSVDSAGNSVWLVTRSVFDANGRVVAETDPYIEGTTAPITGTLTSYDALGDVIQTQGVTGMVIDLIGTAPNAGSVLTSSGTVATHTASRYDNLGRIVSSIDQYGHESLTTYDRFGRVVDVRAQSVDQTGNLVWIVTRTVYNAQGQVELSTDQYQDGSSQPIDATEIIYDAFGRAVRSIRLAGAQVGLCDANTGQAVDPLDPGNAVVVSRVMNWGATIYETQTVYDSLGRVTRVVDAAGQTTDLQYDSFGRQTATIGQAVEPALVGVTIPAGDPVGTLVRLRTETAYDDYGNVIAKRGNIFVFVLPDGSSQLDYSHMEETQYQYDQFDHLVKTIYPDGSTTSAAYNNLGEQVSTTDQLGQTTQYQYDSEGRMTAVVLPAVTNPATGHSVNPTYQYSYDSQGNRTSIADANGGITTFTFDAQRNQLSRTLPLGQTETMQYDSQNRQTLAVSFEGAVVQYVYDPNTGNLAQKLVYPNLSDYNNGQGTPAETITYKYDAFGRQVEVDDTVGSASNAVTSVTTTTYDFQGNILSITSPQGTVSYAYDNLGRKIKTLIGPANAPTSETDYTYEALGRLASVTVVKQNGVALSTPEQTTYEYDLQGKLIQEVLPTEVVDQYAYDDMNRLTRETENGPANTPIAEYDYTYRADGLKATAIEDFWFANNGQNVEVTNNISYTYDALDRLTDEAFVTNADQILGFDASLPSGVRQWKSFNDQYAYDLDSNQIQKTTEFGTDEAVDETVTSTYDGNDRLLQQLDTTSTGSITTAYSYTDNGSGTQQAGETVYSGTPSSPGTIQSSQQYQYNLQGQMSAATVTTYTNGAVSQIEQLTYSYDADGNRVSALDQVGPAAGSWITQTLTEYLNDSNNLTGYSQVLRTTQTDPTSGQIQQVTEYAIGLRQFSQTTTVYTNGQSGTAMTLYFGFDGHGSVRVLLNAAGAIATIAGVRQIFNYDAYGNAVGFNLKAAATVLLYSAQQTDAATGLQYLRIRYTRAQSGTFTSLDPFAGHPLNPQSYNKYLYTQGDPVNAVDPSGMDASLISMLSSMSIIINQSVMTLTEGALIATSLLTFGKAGAQLHDLGDELAAAGDIDGAFTFYNLGGEVFNWGAHLIEVSTQAIQVFSACCAFLQIARSVAGFVADGGLSKIAAIIRRLKNSVAVSNSTTFIGRLKGLLLGQDGVEAYRNMAGLITKNKLGQDVQISIDVVPRSSLPKNVAAQYAYPSRPVTSGPIRGTIRIADDATIYEISHEWQHLQQHLELGNEYLNLTTLQKETYVYNNLRQSPEWAIFTAEEKQNAYEQVAYWAAQARGNP